MGNLQKYSLNAVFLFIFRALEPQQSHLYVGDQVVEMQQFDQQGYTMCKNVNATVLL